MNNLSDEQVIQFITESLEENYNLLKLEGGHALSTENIELALRQVILYWTHLKNLALNVTDTEVALSLPNQKTDQGVPFTIYGVIDLVNQNDKLFMYDIKTHDCDYVSENINLYEKQLGLYAYIWEQLNDRTLDGAGVIAIGENDILKQELLNVAKEDYAQFRSESWNPLIPIKIEKQKMEKVLQEFKETVDFIEFNPFTPRKLTMDKESGNFIQKSCNNCDVRFNCISYKERGYL